MRFQLTSAKARIEQWCRLYDQTKKFESYSEKDMWRKLQLPIVSEQLVALTATLTPDEQEQCALYKLSN